LPDSNGCFEATPRPTLRTVRPPGRVPYDAGYALQQRLRDDVQQGVSPSALVLLEHERVITLGRNADRAHLLLTEAEYATRGIALRTVNRGGDAAYHGPGQLVAYPILDLALWRRSIRWYLRTLEETLIRQLAGYGLQGERIDGLTGVWVNGAKVAAIGVGIHRWVTFHGIALNVAVSLDDFATIVPCGIRDRAVASLDRLLPRPPTLAQAMDDFERSFRTVFGCREPDAV